MTSDPAKSSKSLRRWRGLVRLSVVVIGIVIIQFILFGSSLVRRTILLPLDVLEERSALDEVGHERVVPYDRLLTDPVFQFEQTRRFAVSEVRAGRMPLWETRNYCGSPFLAANQAAIFSPFRLLDYVWPDPLALAWGQMLKSIVGGIGAYLFFRRAMRCQFIAAAIGAWIWPQSGFLIQWAMWPQSATALWLPWLLLAIRQIVCRRGAGWVLLLALFTCFTQVCGHAAMGAHVLLASGIYAVWLLISRGAGVHSILRIALGWLLGIALAAPQIIPTLDYMRNSFRISVRLQVGTETRPVGLAALPQIVMPWVAGTTRAGWIYLNSDNPLESAVGGYVGLLAVVVLLPHGFADPRRRKDQFFWIALAIVGAAYVLDLPGGFAMHRLPVLSSLNGNRFIMVCGFALLAASVAGLDALLGARARRSGWLFVAPLLALCAAGWCVWRVTVLPELVSSHATQALQTARSAGADLEIGFSRGVDQLVDRFQTVHFIYAGLCALAAIVSIVLILRPRRWLAAMVGLAAVVEVLINVYPINPQSDAKLYDWNLPVYKAIAAAEPGRICGVRCLPPALNQWGNLSDIRGYDAADPKRYIEFLLLLADPNSPPPDPHAATYAFTPRAQSPLADFIGLRYQIFQGRPPEGLSPRIVTPGYFVIENRSAMPRVTVPKHAVNIPDNTARLTALSDPLFDPHETVIVESAPGIAAGSSTVGEARIVKELPTRIEIDYTMQTPGLIVIADEWDSGWHATVNGTDTPVLRANHAFRAVAVPQGSGKLVFTYDPASFRIGLWIFAGALVACIVLWWRLKIRPYRSAIHAG